jgi:hypothetical protein
VGCGTVAKERAFGPRVLVGGGVTLVNTDEISALVLLCGEDDEEPVLVLPCGEDDEEAVVVLMVMEALLVGELVEETETEEARERAEGLGIWAGGREVSLEALWAEALERAERAGETAPSKREAALAMSVERKKERKKRERRAESNCPARKRLSALLGGSAVALTHSATVSQCRLTHARSVPRACKRAWCLCTFWPLWTGLKCRAPPTTGFSLWAKSPGALTLLGIPPSS